MKLIITEEQLRMIIESEKEDNLIDFKQFKGISPNKWDNMFLHINKKKDNKYKGYYFSEDLMLSDDEVDSLDYLIKVTDDLIITGSNIKSMDRLEQVGGDLDLYKCKIKEKM